MYFKNILILVIHILFSFLGVLASNSEKLIPDVSKIEKVFDEQKSSNKSIARDKGNNHLFTYESYGNSPKSLIQYVIQLSFDLNRNILVH